MMRALRSYALKITLILVLLMFFMGALTNFLISRYALRSQFEQLRHKLTVIADITALLIDPETLGRIPVTKAAMHTKDYQDLRARLVKIKEEVPSIKYIYILARTRQEGVLKFLVDPDPGPSKKSGATAYPGDVYDASGFPEMTAAFEGPTADTRLKSDDWGTFLSGYAPIYGSDGKAIAILGVDMPAKDVEKTKAQLAHRAFLVLFAASALSILLGAAFSRRITKPIRRLLEATRQIAGGKLGYCVKVKGDDEIAELTMSFNRMSVMLEDYVEAIKRTTAEKERMHRELEIARAIQQSFLPTTAPYIEGFDITAKSFPAAEVGGDFYDYIPVNKDEWGLDIADVSGKGIPAALFMALSRTLMRAVATKNPSIEATMKHLNKLIFEENKAHVFVTLFYAILNSKDMALKYINAGHNPPILLKADSGKVSFLETGSVPLGISADIDMPQGQIQLHSKDLVVFYTDGIVDANNEGGERFGEERLADMVIANRHLTSAQIFDKIIQALNLFCSRQPQFDDITLMVLKAV